MRNLFLAVTLLLFASFATWADSVAVTLDTAGLIGNASGPYTLDFQFVEGNGIGDSNNTIALSDFAGAVITTSPSSNSGGVSVTALPFSFSLTDSSFFNDVQFAFTPGATLTFDAAYTTNDDSVAPDTFTFAILDKNGNEISTDNANGFDSFIEIDLPSSGNGTGTTVTGSASTDANQSVPDPIIVPLGSPVSGVPEPATYLLLLSAAPFCILVRRRTRYFGSSPRYRAGTR